MVDSIKVCTEINLHIPSLLPTLQCILQCMGQQQKCITGTQTFPISKLGGWKHTTAIYKHTTAIYKLFKPHRHQALKQFWCIVKHSQRHHSFFTTFFVKLSIKLPLSFLLFSKEKYFFETLMQKNIIQFQSKKNSTVCLCACCLSMIKKLFHFNSVIVVCEFLNFDHQKYDCSGQRF